jgi:hypothetical protein
VYGEATGEKAVAVVAIRARASESFMVLIWLYLLATRFKVMGVIAQQQLRDDSEEKASALLCGDEAGECVTLLALHRW